MDQEVIVIKEGAFSGMNELEYVVWQDGGEWYGCGTGYGAGNNTWEGDDIGPFGSRQEVIDELDEMYD